MPALPPVEFSDRCRSYSVRQTDETSRFSRLECLRHARVYDSAASWSCSPIADDRVLPTPRLNRIDTRLGTDFGAQWLACTDLHFGRSERMCRHKRPSEEGRSRWLVVLRTTLSFSIPSRFSPALLDMGFGINKRAEIKTVAIAVRPPVPVHRRMSGQARECNVHFSRLEIENTLRSAISCQGRESGGSEASKNT